MQSFLKTTNIFSHFFFQKKPKSLFHFDWIIQKMAILFWVLVFSIQRIDHMYPNKFAKKLQISLFVYPKTLGLECLIQSLSSGLLILTFIDTSEESGLC